VPRPDEAVIETLDVVTARTRAIARLLICGEERQGSAPFPSSFGQDYAQLLRALADLVCELVDLGSPRPEHDLTEPRPAVISGSWKTGPGSYPLTPVGRLRCAAWSG